MECGQLITLTNLACFFHHQFQLSTVNLINKKPQIKGVGKIDDNESRIGAYDSASFMKQIKSNQKPDRTSYMRRMKPSKTTNR